jgi:uncharacterized protein (DUF433 family)
MMGKPALTGTRIPVYLILQRLAAGETADEILTAYPPLRAEHIRAALEYAAGFGGRDRTRRRLWIGCSRAKRASKNN